MRILKILKRHDLETLCLEINLKGEKTPKTWFRHNEAHESVIFNKGIGNYLNVQY